MKKHVFLSYCRDNFNAVAQLRDDLLQGGETVWWDQDIFPGQIWKNEIRQAIRESYAVLLCLSQEATARTTSGIFPEALDAIEHYRTYQPGSIFLIPLRLSACSVPAIEINAVHTLQDLQYEDLFPAAAHRGALQRILQALRRTPGHPRRQETLQPSHTALQPTWATDSGTDAYGQYADLQVQGVTQRLRWIAPGEFLMGSPPQEPERLDNEILHRVRLSQDFWLADTACTQALWQAAMGNNPSHFQGCAGRPVEQVSWVDIQDFLRRLHAIVPGGSLRLPTEAEWEYACRAGTTTPFWFGMQITPEQVNYNGNYPYSGGKTGLYRGETVPVQALPCNNWGFYQMHGNVWEWCQDCYGTYSADAAAISADATAVDPGGPAAGTRRVLRGGCWFVSGGDARSALRIALDPGYRNDVIGFRLALSQVRPAGAGGA